MKRTCCRATEILSGRPVRPLPESVERALEELQRRPERPYATAWKPSLSSADWSDSA